MTALPQLRVVDREPLEIKTDALVVGMFEDGIEAPVTDAALEASGYGQLPTSSDFRGRMGQVQVLATPGQRFRRLVVVGLGGPDRLSEETLRRAAGAGIRAVRGDARTVVVTLAAVNPKGSTIQAVAEGALLGAYRYDEQRSDADALALREVQVSVPSRLLDDGRAAAERATAHARAESLARDIVNRPPGQKLPEQMAQLAVEACGDTCEVEVWDEQRLEQERCGGLLGVGAGSVAPPRLVRIHYRPDDPIATVAIVGKGITFDSGGLSLKRPWANMVRMKTDLGGAAAVIGACSVLAQLGIRVEVLGLCAFAENMPDGSAQRPGDVITIRNGTTVEVLNTDAEGRLVLADALSYAAEHELDAIVNLATLTGGVSYAIGDRATALLGTDDDLVRQLLAAAASAGEPTWQLPLWEDLRENLDSEVADLNNLGRGDGASTIMGGLFLREFVGDHPWVHLDIAASSWAEKDRYHLSQGATGSGVRVLLHWLEGDEG